MTSISRQSVQLLGRTRSISRQSVQLLIRMRPSWDGAGIGKRMAVELVVWVHEIKLKPVVGRSKSSKKLMGIQGRGLCKIIQGKNEW